MPDQFLSFRVAGDEYAIEILRAREIVAYGAVTRVPHVPPSIRGVLNLRGTVVPVVDLALRFGLAETPITPRTCVVIVEVTLTSELLVMGIVVDSVSQVLDLPRASIQAAPSFGVSAPPEYLLGLAHAGERFVLLLDLERLLSLGDHQAALARAGASAPPGQGSPTVMP